MKRFRHAATLVLLGVVAASVATLAAVIVQIARRVIRPSARELDAEVLAVDVSAQTIELGRTADTELPGRYGLFTTGTYDYLKVGAVLSADREKVRRKLLTKVDADAWIDHRAAFSGWYYTSPEELHLPFDDVLIPAAPGSLPAWLFPAQGDTWVIQVHGRGATRRECLRAVPALHAQGLPVLVVSYRNDGEAPPTAGGSYALGAAEWRDVDAAIVFALENGARQVVLMGWSMGGAIVLQAAVSSARADAVAGLILESPVVDWKTVLRYQAKAARIADPLPALAMGALSAPWTARLSGAEQAIDFDQLDMVARAADLRVPVLLLHSDDDGFVPSDASHALAAARPDLVTMHTFQVARHTKLWNYDQERWTTAISEWLTAQGLVPEPTSA